MATKGTSTVSSSPDSFNWRIWVGKRNTDLERVGGPLRGAVQRLAEVQALEVRMEAVALESGLRAPERVRAGGAAVYHSVGGVVGVTCPERVEGVRRRRALRRPERAWKLT